MREAAWVRFARRRLWWEIAIVLSLSLIPSALSAVLSLIELTLAPEPIASQQATLNPAAADTVVFDALSRILSFFAAIAPVALVIWLLWTKHRSGVDRLGLSSRHGWRDAGRGLTLAALIGLPGLALYAVSRLAGLTVQVVAGDTSFQWHTVLALLLAAVRAALVEEVIVVGYLAQRLTALRWGPWAIIATAALLRGSYHLYQGIPMALGNVVMGFVFGAAFFFGFRRRVLPLVIAHFTLDATAFLGYPFAVSLWPDVF